MTHMTRYDSVLNWSDDLTSEFTPVEVNKRLATGLMAYYNGHWYVPGGAINKVFVVSECSDNVTATIDFATTNPDPGRPSGPASCLVYDNYLYVAFYTSRQIYRRNLCASMDTAFELFATFASGNDIFHMVVNGSKMYVSCYTNGKIFRLDMTVAPGQTPTLFVTITGTPALREMAVDDVYLYVADDGNDKIQKISLIDASPVATAYANVAGCYGVVARHGYLYVSSSIAPNTGAITKIPLSGITIPVGGILQPLLPTLNISPTTLSNPVGIVLRHGVLYVYNQGTGFVTKIYLTELAEIGDKYGILIKTVGIACALGVATGFLYKNFFHKEKRHKRMIMKKP